MYCVFFKLFPFWFDAAVFSLGVERPTYSFQGGPLRGNCQECIRDMNLKVPYNKPRSVSFNLKAVGNYNIIYYYNYTWKEAVISIKLIANNFLI